MNLFKGDNMVNEKRMVETWEEKTKAAGHQFAQLTTTKAVYDRVAIVAKLPSMITIQFVRGNARRKNLKSVHTPSESFSVVQEGISKKDIVDIKYYRD